MTRSTVLLISFLVAVAATLADYLVGRLANSPSLGIACWAGLVLAVSAVLDAFREWHRDHGHGNGARYTSALDLTIFNNVVRGVEIFRWGTILTSMVAAVLAGICAYIFILVTFTVRYAAVDHGPKLGKSSPFNHSALMHIVGYQTSSTALWFVVASFFLALFLRPPALLPLGVIGVSIASAASVALSPLTRSAGGPFSQLTQSLSAPDAWFFSVPAGDLIWACFAAFVLGVLICGFINVILAPVKSQGNPATRRRQAASVR
jgi:hypothetical protein